MHKQSANNGCQFDEVQQKYICTSYEPLCELGYSAFEAVLHVRGSSAVRHNGRQQCR